MVFKVGEAVSRTLLANTCENKTETLLGPFPPGRMASGPRDENESNRATTSQIETTHRTSQRQVATGLTRNDEKSGGALPQRRVRSK